MNTNEQAPDCCPFCGADFYKREAVIGASGEYVRKTEYKCGSGRVYHQQKVTVFRSSDCAYVIEQRLTRERDAALARVKQLESDWAGWPELQREWFGDKYAAMQPLEAVCARIEDAEARVKRLEEAVGSLLPYAEATDDESSEWGPGRWKSEKLKRIIDEARKAKEATP